MTLAKIEKKKATKVPTEPGSVSTESQKNQIILVHKEITIKGSKKVITTIESAPTNQRLGLIKQANASAESIMTIVSEEVAR
jgi:hypothetical protein